MLDAPAAAHAACAGKAEGSAIDPDNSDVGIGAAVAINYVETTNEARLGDATVTATGVTVERQFASGELNAGFSQLVISEEKTGCAIARKGTLRVADVNAAIDAIEKSGELTRLLRLR